MIENKLGVRSYEQLAQIEKEIISVKVKLLDDKITFNMDDLNLEFLVRVHKFLFSDIYEDKYLKIRKMSEEEYKEIDLIFKQLIRLGVYGAEINLKLLESLFIKLWKYQLFYDGNTRTILAFLKLYIEYYRLPIEYNYDLKIESGPKVFKLKRCQQKTVDNI